MSELAACLPPPLQGAVITKIAAGLSGAGVYRVEANGEIFVLKISGDDEPLATWTGRLAIQTLASTAGLTARLVHSDPDRRAIVSAFVTDRSFMMRMAQHRAEALAELGDVLRRVHALPIPPGTPEVEPRDVLARIWPQVESFALPGFARTAIERALAERPPAADRAPALSHNDVNPSNLVWDGERVLLLDWDTASVNDPLYDLAAVSVFLRLDDATCAQLIATHDQTALHALPARFLYHRRIMSAFIGTVFMRMAHQGGHAGSLDAAPVALLEIYQALREGRLNPQTADGQWMFGLALLTASSTL